MPTITFSGHNVNYNPTPKYLGIILDRSLTYKTHLDNIVAKISIHNNIIQKPVGLNWGTDSFTLKTSTIALVYSVAKYCAPVWINSTHVKQIDALLNHSMRTYRELLNRPLFNGYRY